MRSLALLASGAAFIAALGHSPPAAAGALPWKPQIVTLENGLKLVMVRQAGTGLIAYYTFVRVGSRDEVEPGVTGFAHFFEHMMFRGTEKFTPEVVTAYLKKTGADQNGFTTDDFTCYTFFGRSDFLPELVAMEADRFQNLKYSEDAFKTESKAVLGEYNKSASSPFLKLSERLRELSFTKHTYGHTTLGYLKDIEDMPNQYAYSQKFLKRFYTPDNAIIVAVGDFEVGALEREVRAKYAPWKSKRAKSEIKAEPPQTKEIRDRIEWKTPTLPLLSLSWRTPQLTVGSIDAAVYSVLFELMFGETSAIHNELVLEKQTVDRFNDGSGERRDPYLFHVVAVVKDPAAIESVEKRVDAVVAELSIGKVDPAALAAVKSRVRYQTLLSLSTPSKIADALVWSIAPSGEVDALEKSLAAIDKITVKDVQAFARKVLNKENRAVIVLAHTEEKR